MFANHKLSLLSALLLGSGTVSAASAAPTDSSGGSGSGKSSCPFGFGRDMTIHALSEDLAAVRDAARSDEYVAAATALRWDAVVADIKAALTTPQPEIYPIDRMLDGSSTYAPFFIRQAWHCAGSYRVTDGLGGCSGGRQLFNPELSWADNTNLDKAKRMLWPIKQKYGLGLSWGDLMILTGKVAIEAMGGPAIGFCAGRPDDEDGSKSELLGPTVEQEETYPCAVQGDCKAPFGTTNVGLIYVNPQGHRNDYTALTQTAEDINHTFSHMAMNQEETVALIGGGHSFGKTHGACAVNTSDPAAWPDPVQNPADPWPIAACGNGTFTSGFEGYWTSKPNRWTNECVRRAVGGCRRSSRAQSKSKSGSSGWRLRPGLSWFRH
jgi:catalase-peroxidase